MTNYQNIVNLSDIEALWNNEMGFIYPIAADVFKRGVYLYQEKFVYGTYDEDKLVGFIIAKKKHDEILPSYAKKGWLSLFYVAKKYRQQGIGSKLLLAAEDYLRDKDEILLGQDVGNFFPGLPSDFNNLTDLWLNKRGYLSGRTTHDLINYKPKLQQIQNTNYLFRVATKEDKEALLSLFATFSERWFHEGYTYFQNDGNGDEYVVCCHNNKIIAFSRINDSLRPCGGYNMTWYERFEKLGGIGPLGVLSSYRKQGLGKDIVAFAINELIKRGKKVLIIDWTGLLEFYQQFGFEVWKTYKYMSKKA